MTSAMRALRILAIAGLLIGFTSAQASFRTGQDSDIRFNWGVPEQAAASGSGNVYLQLDAPDTYSWIALGIGENMMTAKIFLVYQDGEGNVTLSTRQGQNHIMPTYVDRPKVELISGSKAVDGRMVAKVRCGDCEDLDLNGENSWVAAWAAGDAVNNKSPRAAINHHDDKRIFAVDLSKASIESESNSFAEADEANQASDSDYGIITDTDEFSPIRLAHGIIMTTVFVGIYPLGALLMPVFNKWFLHSASQLLAYILMWVGVALGVTYSRQTDLFGKQTHTRMGLFVVILLSLQPVLGYLHHRYFSKHQKIGIVGYIHIWYGRALMILGVVNGGLGLQLTGQSGGSWVISYSVIASTCFVAYTISIIMSLSRQRRRRQQARPSNERWPSPDSLLQTGEETYYPSSYQGTAQIPMKDLTRNRDTPTVGDDK